MKKKTGSILIFVLKTFRREGFFGVTNMYTSPQSIEFVLSNAIATREELRRSEAKSPRTVEIVLGTILDLFTYGIFVNCNVINLSSKSVKKKAMLQLELYNWNPFSVARPPPPRKYSKKYSRILEYILGICRKIRVSTSILKNGTRVPKYSSTEILGRITDASTVYNCNLVEMPITVSNLLVAGEVRIFNFVENMNPLYVRKEMENCLPVAF